MQKEKTRLRENPKVRIPPTRFPLRRQAKPVHSVRQRLVTDAQSRAIGKHAGGNVHGEEFLEEQLGGVGDVDLGDAGFVVAGAAFVEALFELAGNVGVS